jgi:hypothetical protein
MDEYGFSVGELEKVTGLSRSQASAIINDGFTNDKPFILPEKPVVRAINAWSDGDVTYADWYTD